MRMQPLPGNPGLVATRAAAYQQTAVAILAAAASLEGLASERSRTISTAVGKLRSLSQSVSTQIRHARKRYADTADALAVYAVSLGKLEAQVAQAIRQQPVYKEMQGTLQRRILALTMPAMTGIDPRAKSMLEEAEQELSDVNRRLQQIASSYQSALAQRDTAAQTAIEAIRSAIDHDGLKDPSRNLFQQGWKIAGDAVSALTAWYDQYLLPALKKLIEAIRNLLEFLLAAVLLVALVVVLAAFFVVSPFAVLAVILIAAAIIALTIYQQSQELKRIDSKEVRDFEGNELKPQDRTLGPDGSPNSVTDVLAEDQMEIDPLSAASDSAVIRITEVKDEHGNVIGIRVQIPSTQEWNPGSFKSPTSGYGNVLGFFNPNAKTALERAVLQAMEDANIPPGVPVMLSGFSQGGKVAIDMAANREYTSRWNIKEVVTFGTTEIDRRVPPGINVTAISHHNDAANIPRYFSDSSPGGRPSNYQVVSAGWKLDFGKGLGGAVAHNMDMYKDSTRGLGSLNDLRQRSEGVFFSSNEEASRYAYQLGK